MIITQVKIARSPEEVRKIFLNFPSYRTWHNGLIKCLSPLSPSSTLSKSEKLHCEMRDFSFDAVITENSPSRFQWQGPPVKGVLGLHTFVFELSKVTPSGTTFSQTEYAGIPAFLMQPWLLGRTLKAQFEKFNHDFKARAESTGS